MKCKLSFVSFLLWLIPFCARIPMNISYENVSSLGSTNNSALSILYDALEDSSSDEAFLLVFKNNIKSCLINDCGGVSLGVCTIVNLAYNGYPNLRFSFHKVWQEPENAELKKGMADLKRAVAGKNFTSNMNTYFGDSVNPCYGDFANNYVINYNGDVFKCTAREFSEENRLGKLMNNGEIVFNERALERTRKRWTNDCLTCRRLPICPICSQVKSESKDGKCPVHMTPDVAAMNIREYFFDLQT